MAEGAGGRRAELERRLIERSLEDEEFRRRLLDDPKGAVEQEIGTRLPQEIKLRVVEESPDTIYLVLPRSLPLGGEGEELSDRELDAVAGGVDTFSDACYGYA
jgi:Nitrile hydratase, alpha chain